MAEEHGRIEVSVSEEDITPDPQSPEADQLIAGKFKSQDDLVRAYKELESKLGAPRQEDATVTTEAEDASPAAPARPDGTIDTSVPAAEEFSLHNAAEELSEKGGLSEATYEKLAKKGMSKADVDTWAEGIQARSNRIADDLRSAAGGPEQFNRVLEWARTGLSAEEVKAYNDAVGAGNATVAKMLLRSMVSSYEASAGRDPSLVGGDNVPQNRGVRAFESQEQLVAAMGDPRYREDAKYRAEVDARVAVSDVI